MRVDDYDQMKRKHLFLRNYLIKENKQCEQNNRNCITIFLSQWVGVLLKYKQTTAEILTVKLQIILVEIRQGVLLYMDY